MTPEFWLLLAVNIIGGIFGTGIIYNKQIDVDRRLARIESIFDQIVSQRLAGSGDGKSSAPPSFGERRGKS